MSKKSSARTGSEGDADSTFAEVHDNACPGSSSYKIKRDLEGGACGDSPTVTNSGIIKDYVVLMFRENDESGGTSESTEPDQELYNLKNDYIEKLNIVRKRLNLMEISEAVREDTHSRGKCVITEIIEEEPPDSITLQQEEIQPGLGEEENNSPDTYTLTTIHPPAESCITDSSSSSTDIFEMEYNPPKKKICHRLKTPKLTSVSDGQLPYYTKVTLRDDMFKEEPMPVNIRKGISDENNYRRFTETRETQCTEEEFKFTAGRGLSRHNIFPNVIVETKVEDKSDDGSSSSMSSKKSTYMNENRSALGLNNVIHSSADDSYTTITNITIIDNPNARRKVRKKRLRRRNKVGSSEKFTLWEEIKKLRSGNDLLTKENLREASDNIRNLTGKAGDSNYIQEVPQSTYDGRKRAKAQDTKTKKSRYLHQYLNYRKEMERAKLLSLRTREDVVCGPGVANDHNRLQYPLRTFYHSDNSLFSNEEKETKLCSSGDNKKSLWKRMCFCFCASQEASE